ncbi:hypothetical protein ACROYT_G044289 [Oculina patagonica]
MENIVEIIQTISIGLIVADFLINTCRVPKAIELCKECLFILDNTPLITEEKTFKLLYKAIYWAMSMAYLSIDDYTNVIKYATNILPILRECGDRVEECTVSRMLAESYFHQSKYVEAKEHSEKALLISTEIGDEIGEALCYENLGAVYLSIGEYEKAKEYHMKALAINKEIGDKIGEAICYGNLGAVYQSVGEYEKAKEYRERALMICKEIGNRNGTASSCVSLGTVLKFLGQYEKAKEYLEEALAIEQEIGDKERESRCYRNLGDVFQCVGEYVKAKEYYEKAFAISREIDSQKLEGAVCRDLGALFLFLGKYAEANEYLQKALALSKTVGNKNEEASVYTDLGSLFQSIGDYEKSREYLEKAITISKKTGSKHEEATNYSYLGNVFKLLGEYGDAEEYYKRALAISEEIGDISKQSKLLGDLGWIMLRAGKIEEALLYLRPSIQKCEDLRGFLGDNDQFKISFSHEKAYAYTVLTKYFCSAGNPNKALYVSELRRARALADLMSAQYSMENPISANPQSCVGIENVMDKELRSTCLYIFYFSHGDVYLWIPLKGQTDGRFRKVDGKEIIAQEGLIENLDEFFSNERFRSLVILPDEQCEDRSLNDFQRKPCEEDIRKASRIGNDVKDNQDTLKRNLSLCHKLIIAPAADLIDGPEIIIVPERSLYNIPFAALPDECGNYLSENFRIRVVPSLTTLKLIQDSPADYHSKTGALIVGNPDVGKVRYKGRLKFISRLPCAESEANMIGEKLGVKPLLGKQATKQAVLQVINSVSLIHFAAHGDAERGEIALSPLRTLNRIPREEDYLLTMSDISKVQLRAKLVVLSCCHSGRGQIRAEGAVGIARAFLGSGARSVLVALWALEDSATEQFMNRFYEHLVGGDSASESLHEAMKWMRCNGYSEVRQWAPFMLMGDNVTFDFGKTK